MLESSEASNVLPSQIRRRFDKTTKTCSMATSAPSDTEKFSMMGVLP
jgi:hypothetical protein